MKALRQFSWVVGLLLGLALVAGGAFFIAKGVSAKAEIRAALLEEQITTSQDAEKVGGKAGVLVSDPTTAKWQSDTIKLHTLGRWGPYSKMAREDPNRQTYVNGVALRTALNLAILGWGVADLAIGTGAFIILAGVATLGVAVPVLYWWGKPAVALESARARPAQAPGLAD
ncbi:hypothetical protein HRbin23_00319 [bacterium HR23]|nr:hypothetical protein HRbin23_00319 [bacterium HR23]